MSASPVNTTTQERRRRKHKLASTSYSQNSERSMPKSYRKQQRSRKNKQAATVPFTAGIAARAVKNRRQNARKSTKNRARTTKKSIKIRSWTVLGVKSRFGDASGRVRDAPGTRQSRPGSDLGTPRARQERPGVVQERPRDGPKTLPGLSGATSERVQRDKHCRKRRRSDFFALLSCRA